MANLARAKAPIMEGTVPYLRDLRDHIVEVVEALDDVARLKRAANLDDLQAAKRAREASHAGLRLQRTAPALTEAPRTGAREPSSGFLATI